jgi:hypothetical protein
MSWRRLCNPIRSGHRSAFGGDLPTLADRPRFGPGQTCGAKAGRLSLALSPDKGLIDVALPFPPPLAALVSSKNTTLPAL